MTRAEAQMIGSQLDGPRLFPSKRDAWLVALLVVSALVLGSTSIALAIARPAPLWVALSVAALLLAAAAAVVWVLNATSYRVSATELHIRCGPLRWNVALDAVDEVVPTREVLGAPALSFDRLRVLYRGTRVGVLVSPRDRDGFLDCVASHCSHLRRDGDRLVRVP